MKARSRIAFAFVFLVLALSTAAHAVPQVFSAHPPRQWIDMPATTTIQVNFTEVINPASVDPISFRVFGRWSGPASGSFAVVGKVVTFTPDLPFFAGEWVTVNLSRSIENTVGEPMAKGYAWNFWIKSGPGSLDLVYDGRITTRQGNETWVQPYGGYAGDLDNDGWSDLTVPCEQTGDARIFMNDGAGAYTSFTVESLVSNSQSSPNEGADFNNDGEIDMVFGDSNGNAISVLLGDGTGDFPDKTFHTAGSSVRGVGVVDLNGDGWDDIVTANLFGNNLSIFINNGDGTFPPAGVAKEAGGNGEVSIAVADANNDGLLDVFSATYGSPYVVIVLLSDGNGGLVAQPPVPSGGHPWLQITVGDFNGDGNVDTALNHTYASGMGVLHGDGLGGLGAVQSYPTGDSPFAIDAADIDGDGDLELVSSDYSGTWTIYENVLGVFMNPRTLDSDESGSCAVMHDRDNDGDLDLTGFDEVNDWLYFYENVLPDTGITPSSGQMVTLRQNHPNPFNPLTTIRFELTHAANVKLAVYDAGGAFVARIAEGRYAEGPHEEPWNGTDARGASVASGVYFYRLVSGSTVLTRKMVLLK